MSHTTEFKFKYTFERESWYEIVRAALQSGVHNGAGASAADWAIEVADTVLKAERSRRSEEMKR